MNSSKKNLLNSVVLHIHGSPGDKDPRFIECTKVCRQEECKLSTKSNFLLSIFMWDCDSNCSYECMRQIVTKDREEGRQIHQYFGKWPFIRILGCQEIASVIFSILNGVAHYKGLALISSLSDMRYAAG